MKEKIKKYICSWKFCLHLNVLFMLAHILFAITDLNIAYIAGANFHFGLAIMSWILIQYDKEHKKDAELIHALDYLLAHLIKESEKKNSENTENTEQLWKAKKDQ